MTDSFELLRFLRPQLLWVLLPWALLIYWSLRRVATVQSPQLAGDSPWSGVIAPDLLAALQAKVASEPRIGEPSPAARKSASMTALAILGTLLVLALAGPQVFRPSERTASPLRPDAARVLLIDLSPAFDALPANDRQRLRANLRRFAHELPAGETALVVAAGEAWQVVPPSEDAAALDGFLAELDTGVVPVKGDQPGQGLALARQILAASGSRQTDIFWLRVGPLPPVEARSLRQSGVAPIFLQVDGTVEDWLAQARAAAPPAAWTKSVLNLAARPDAGWIDLGPYLILLALPFGAFAALRTGQALGLVFCLALGASLACDPAVAASAASGVSGADAFAQGVALYRAGRHDEAAAAFARAPAGDPRAHYNRGNALARAGQLRAALAAYDESLHLRPGDASTQHNREIVARLLQPPPNPPPPPATAPPAPSSVQAAEAARAAEQWLRRPPSGSDGLLKRKLALEESRRKLRGEP